MKVLYIMSSMNIYGGTPKKTLDLLKVFREDSSIYFYTRDHLENIESFKESGSSVYLSLSKPSILYDLRNILKIVDEEEIEVIQTQFFRGELIGFFAKLMRPRVKLVVAFVGPFNPTGVKKFLSRFFYKFVDAFVFISDYVKKEKIEAFPGLGKASSRVIFNGTEERRPTADPVPKVEGFILLDVAGLVDWKNIGVLVEAMNILVNKRKLSKIKLLLAGDGPQRSYLQNKIINYDLEENVSLMGYQKNIGGLLNACDVFVHPAYAEGFGIAAIEAMMAGKAVIVSNAGALPELVDHQVTGLIVDAFNADAWADAIDTLYNDSLLSSRLGKNASDKAKEHFSVDQFVKNYECLYESLLGHNQDSPR